MEYRRIKDQDKDEDSVHDDVESLRGKPHSVSTSNLAALVGNPADRTKWKRKSIVTLSLTVLTSSQAILIVWSKRAGKYEYSVTTANFLVETLKCALSVAALARIWRNEGVTDDNRLSTTWDEVSVYPIPAALYLIKNLLQVGSHHSLTTWDELHILVPGCGNKRLSDHLHNAGFRNITNVDFLRFMDMTSTQFQIEEFDAIVDQGGLDALMEADPRFGNLYLSKVKTVLKARGKYICLTLAESHVLDLLFPHFRFGWEMSLHTIAQDTSSTNMKVQTFVVVAEKDHRTAVSDISVFLNNCFVQCHGDQDHELWEALKKERKIRTEYSYSLEDLKLGAKGSMSLFEPGRRIKLILGEPGVSDFFYNSVLLDAKQDPGWFIHQYCVFIVPKLRARDWIYTSEEGQWVIIKSSKAARLLMVLLDSSNSIYSMEHIQKELSPFVKQLAPRCIADDNTFQIPFLVASYGIKEGQIVHQVISDLNGSVVVEDVAYLDRYTYCRLIFEKTKNLVQSEACLKVQSEASGPGAASSSKREVISTSMESPYHNGIIKGLLLFCRYLMSCHLCKEMKAAKTVVLGLGAGLLPMYMKKHNLVHKTEVVELDHVVLDVARECFGFEEHELLKVHITEMTKYVK